MERKLATIVYKDGTRFEGQVHNGKRHGKGTITYPTGYRYTGEWINDICMNENANIYFPDGSFYSGPICDGIPHGLGKMYAKAIGKFLEGGFIKGFPHGEFREYKLLDVSDHLEHTLYNCGHLVNAAEKRFKGSECLINHPFFKKTKGVKRVKLAGDITIVIVFADNPSTAWDEETKSIARHSIQGTFRFLENTAAYYGTRLRISMVEREDDYAFTTRRSCRKSLMREIKGKREYYNNLRKEAEFSEGSQATAVIVLFNETIIDNASPVLHKSASRMTGILKNVFSWDKNILARMILELFGAKRFDVGDLYLYAKTVYPISIMLESEKKLYLPIDPATAFLVGWTDNIGKREKDFFDFSKRIIDEGRNGTRPYTILVRDSKPKWFICDENWQ